MNEAIPSGDRCTLEVMIRPHLTSAMLVTAVVTAGVTLGQLMAEGRGIVKTGASDF